MAYRRSLDLCVLVKYLLNLSHGSFQSLLREAVVSAVGQDGNWLNNHCKMPR